MIGKLIKYDLKKMLKILLYIYVVALALSGITRLINIGRDIQFVFIIGQVFAGFSYSALASILVNTFVHIIRVFIVNFYKDESYLTHTLPISKNKLLISKYVSSLIVVLCSVLVCLLSLFIMFYTNELANAIKLFFEATIPNFNMSVGLFVFIVLMIVFVQICAYMTFAFTAIIKANQYNHRRVLKGLIWFFIFYLGSMIVTLIIALIAFAIGGNLNDLMASQMSQSGIITLLIIALVTYIAYIVIFYFISRKLFNKGVNVD